jgi:predicted transcriptional regulator of viral defense system
MDLDRTITRTLQRQRTASIHELQRCGASRPQLYRKLQALMEAGRITRLRRGVYAWAENQAPAETWIEAQHKYSKGVLCLLSALLFHGVTTQAPSVVWLALPKGSRPPAKGYPPIKAIYLSGAAYEAGLETHQRPAGAVRVYSVAKTVADCFKFRNRIGLDVALEALKEGWRSRRFTLDELNRMARVCRVQAVMQPYVEALVS